MTERTGSTRGGDRGSRESSERSGYRYQSRSPDAMKKRGDQGGTDFDTYIKDIVNMFKPNDGDNIIRALPPTWDITASISMCITVLVPTTKRISVLRKCLRSPVRSARKCIVLRKQAMKTTRRNSNPTNECCFT